jgi:hypothetical protein
MSDAGNLMPIGRFARSCRLSIKALRHYDSEGLLAPAHIDPFSGYRYYARSQARDAILIAMLRSSSILVAQPITTSQDRLIPDTTHAIYTLMRAIRAAGRDILMPGLCLNEYDDSEDRITVYCCAAVEAPRRASQTRTSSSSTAVMSHRSCTADRTRNSPSRIMRSTHGCRSAAMAKPVSSAKSTTTIRLMWTRPSC